ncbi:MAG: hypothetical protein WD712_01155 [Candidatus Spechtbacterales bacterium]
MKKNIFKKIIPLAVFSILVLTLAVNANAAGIDLNVNYPKIPAPVPGGFFDLNCIEDGTCNPTIGNIILFLFVASIWIGGLVAFTSLIYTGIQFIVGGESPAVRAAARERLKNVVWGIFILLLSVIILNIINPQITNLQDPSVKPAGCAQWNFSQCPSHPECEWKNSKCVDKIEPIGVPDEPDCNLMKSEKECDVEGCDWNGKECVAE